MEDELKSADPALFIEHLEALMDPWRVLTSPVFIGMDRVPQDRPLLFVGNHTLFGLIDAPFLVLELYKRHKIWVRSLGDHLHFKVPGWGSMLKYYGVVDGTRRNCNMLMEAQEAILVFPGGAREVSKRKGEKYKLIWKERLGFIRMALRHGCTIVPFSAVGVEDSFDILIDSEEIFNSPLGKVLRRLKVREDAVWPIAKGIGLTPLPRPQRLYFHISEPISTTEWAGKDDDDELCRALRRQVAAAVTEGIDHLIEYRRTDPKRDILPRVLHEAGRRIFGGIDAMGKAKT